MSDDLFGFLAGGEPSPQRPLLGLTILVVEDSRFACEAMRLLCLRSGARIRRADCLRSARRHLQTYFPNIIVVDLGLPDGSGTELIAELATLAGQGPVILGTSADPDGEAAAMAAGANGFLAKPIESLVIFQQAVLRSLPPEARPKGLRVVSDENVAPDTLALRDDLAHAADVLSEQPSSETLDYITQFISGVARSAYDRPLEEAAVSLAQARRKGIGTAPGLAQLEGLVQARLAAGAHI